VADIDDAEDILQDVFCELVEATRMMKPIEHVSGWLFRVARNRITDRFRQKRAQVSTDDPVAGEENLLFEDLPPSSDAGPEAAYARQVLLDELDAALDELPDEQRDVFIAHAIEGRSFKELATETGLRVNTLLARKRYAVLRLRRRFGPSTTNSGTREEKHDETALDIESAEVPGICGIGGAGAQYRSHESVELADASHFLVAADHLLASAGSVGARQGSLRSLRWRTRPADALASSHDGALEPDDARGARKVYGRLARSLPAIWTERDSARHLTALQSLAGHHPISASRAGGDLTIAARIGR